MKKTLVLAVMIIALFNLSAKKKMPVCGPFITFRSVGITINSIDVSGPAISPFTITSPGSLYSTAIGTFSPTFVLHFASGVHSGTACFAEDTGNPITGVSFATNASDATVTASGLTCTNYTLTVSRGPDCPQPR
jgi:hypothetical protein